MIFSFFRVFHERVSPAMFSDGKLTVLRYFLLFSAWLFWGAGFLPFLFVSLSQQTNGCYGNPHIFALFQQDQTIGNCV